eukprot:5286649-Pyramimonas_sp.AAC.1
MPTAPGLAQRGPRRGVIRPPASAREASAPLLGPGWARPGAVDIRAGPERCLAGLRRCFSPIRACLCRGPSGFLRLGEVRRRFRRHARVPGCPGAL